MLKQEKNKNIYIIVGVISFVFGLILLSSNYINSKVLKAYNNMNLEILALENINLEEKKDEELKEEDVKGLVSESEEETLAKIKKQTKKLDYKYVAKLSINKINLNQGLVAYKSKYNKVDYNIQTIMGSEYPDKEKSNLILAAHSGSGSISYFKNLYKLQKGDECKIEYNGKTYIYKIDSIYKKPKTGKIAIYRDYSKTTLTLITCTRNSNTKQTVYVAYLEDIR